MLFRQPWFTAAGVVFLGLLTATVIRAFTEPAELHRFQNLYLVTFFFGGLLFTSQIFKELHSPHQSYFFHTLPASTLEKLAGAWLLTSPIYILTFTLLSFAVFLLSFLIVGEPFSLSYFFNDALGKIIISYMVIQTIFLWGAVYFRKNNFLKTVLAILVAGILLSVYGAALRHWLLDNQMLVFVKSEDFAGDYAFPSNLFGPYPKILFWWVFGPYMLLMTYFTLKEREV